MAAPPPPGAPGAGPRGIPPHINPTDLFRLVKGTKPTKVHVLRFTGTKSIDLASLPKPITLARRPPHTLPSAVPASAVPAVPVTAAETAAQVNDALASNVVDLGASGAAAAQKPKVTADTAQIAPYGGAVGHRARLFQKKTRDIHIIDETVRKTRFEESVPWVLAAGDTSASPVIPDDLVGLPPGVAVDDAMDEFDDDVQGGDGADPPPSFVGALENQLADYMLFIPSGPNTFEVVPADSWYKFTARSKHRTLTLEQAEELDKRRGKKGRRAHVWADALGGGDSADHGPAGATTASSAAAPASSLYRPPSRIQAAQNAALGGDIDELDFDLQEQFADDDHDVLGDLADEREGAQREMKRQFALGLGAAAAGMTGGEVDDDWMPDAENEARPGVGAGSARGGAALDDEGRAMRRILGRDEGDLYGSDEDDSDEDEEGRDAAAQRAAAEQAAAPAATAAAPVPGRKRPPTESGSGLGDEPAGSAAKKPRMAAPGGNGTAAPTAAAAPGDVPPLTKEMILDLVRVKKLTANQLIEELGRDRLRGPNRQFLVTTVKKYTIRGPGGVLVLRETPKA
ncbi:hypothetical protein AMAG_16472 [Allomyces macrogynus ATCC 38327]|uniref:Transcription initiation factor IIF subunit alpha n=1 Tax=Allomyces macrogynus (strain ATCC 38327) TaxID=578462 RepID=A0A0L0TCI9_ALLM3|nr:hypothetical protein AMAG_16472 [Allomyces macrogynus ATCC 38327]|eukprot:KNE72420.1 hypothetical protein AMAG_16472 [Allomyces macrogynus ATCC 38327]